MRLIEQPYITPVGFVDFPFSYVYDATALTDGQTYYSITKQLQGDSDFVLRRILGVPSCIASSQAGGRWNYKNSSGSYAAGNPGAGICAVNCWPIVPEKMYAANRQINFDLLNVSRAFTVCGGTPIYNSFIAFQGVKRFSKDHAYVANATPYKFRPLKYSYSYSLTLNTTRFSAAGAINGPQQLSQLLDTYDFELLRVSICVAGTTGTLTTNDFAITLYDSSAHQLSDLPMPQSFINNGRRTPRLGPPFAGLSPVPSLVYPGGGAIVFDIQSFLCASQLPQTYNIVFDGLWRVPC